MIILEKNFKFTIITAFYNTGKYLRESIESVINQDIGFEDNVQYILVDDGSDDNSKDIALEYQKLYPQNILVLSKENGGVASARNLGLKYIEGEYVNFLDSDDKFATNSLKAIDDYLSSHTDVDVVAMPLMYFGRKTGKHHLNYKFEKEDGVIDLVKDYNYPHSHISSSFIRYDTLKNHDFEERLVNGSDLLFMNKILIDIKKYGVTSSTYYNYRKRPDGSSIMDTAKKSKRYFTEKMKLAYKELINYSIKKDGNVPKFIQYLIAQELNAIVRSRYYEDNFTDSKEIEEFWECLRDILSYIDMELIEKHNLLSFFVKSFYIYIKNNDFHFEINPERNQIILKVNDYLINRLHNHILCLDYIEIRDNQLVIGGFMRSKCKSSSLNFKAELTNASNEAEYYNCKYVTYPKSGHRDKKLLGIPWDYFYNFEVSIPLIEEDYKINFKVLFEEDGESASFYPKVELAPYCNLSEISNYYVSGSKIVLFRNGTIHVVKKSALFRHRLEFASMRNILGSDEKFSNHAIYIRILCAFVFIFLRNRRIWLFMDHPTFGVDNAKHLFAYSCNQKDNIDKYYIVDKDAAYFDEMKKINKNIVPWGSIKHKILYLYGEKIISSYANHNLLNPFHDCDPILFSGLTTIKTCFLQHDVSRIEFSINPRRYYYNFYLFLTNSDYERDYFISDTFSYSEESVQSLGFPRYDNLRDIGSSKEILFMPDWRKYIKNVDYFENSQYFIYVNNFLNDKELLKLIKENGYNLIFKPPNEMVPFIESLNIPDEIDVRIEESNEDLFNKSSLLITDYSKVSFDFSYLKKPVIYYQGNDWYIHKQEYFDYETMGFGEVINSSDRLFDKVNEYIETDCEMEEVYKKRVDDFFKYIDSDNCKRVYDWLYHHKG